MRRRLTRAGTGVRDFVARQRRLRCAPARCSCERVFDPALAGLPAIVLFNNDRCAIARTAGAKALGIRRSVPFFKIRDMCRSEGVRLFPSSYTLYADMVARRKAVFRGFLPRVEVYSIDQIFCDVSDERVELARDLRVTARAA